MFGTEFEKEEEDSHGKKGRSFSAFYKMSTISIKQVKKIKSFLKQDQNHLLQDREQSKQSKNHFQT